MTNDQYPINTNACAASRHNNKRKLICCLLAFYLFCPSIAIGQGYPLPPSDNNSPLVIPIESSKNLDAQIFISAGWFPYLLNNSSFDLILSLRRKDGQKIKGDQIRYFLFLPKDMRLVSQSDFDRDGRVFFTIHVASQEGNSKIGLFIYDKTSGETLGYWSRFNGVVSLSSADRIIANVSPPLAGVSGVTVLLSLLDYALQAIFSGIAARGSQPSFSQTGQWAISLFLVSGAGIFHSDSVIKRSPSPSFEKSLDSGHGDIVQNSMTAEELNYYKDLILKRNIK